MLRIKEGTPEDVKQEAMAVAKLMAQNESTTYTSDYRGKRYAKKNQTSLFGDML